MNFIMESIIEKIKTNNKISIFFHEIPDFDALGAAFAMKRFIKDFDNDKEVRIIGLDVLEDSFGKGFFKFDKEHVNNSFLMESLGIILDTANAERIWTGRHVYCKELIRIDHHPQVESIGELEWIDDSYPATCQMLATLFYEWNESIMLPPTAMYLYAGIITDTGRFMHSTTLPSTYEICGRLVSTNFDRQKIHDAIYLKSIKEVKFDSYVISRVKYDYDLGFAYCIIPKNAFDKYNITLRMSYVHVLNNIENLKIWTTLYYDDTVKAWRGSLRSRNLPINQIAEKFNGGGHVLAAGFTLKNKAQFKQLCQEIVDYLKQYESVVE